MTAESSLPRAGGWTVYGVFKGMGDLLAASGVILAEIGAGRRVTLLVFGQVRPFVDLLEFGRSPQLSVIIVARGRSAAISLLRTFRGLHPDLVLISPHAPKPAASRKVPLMLWVAKRLYWRAGRLVGASDEPFSVLFDERIPVDRDAPLAQREWQLYAGWLKTPAESPVVRFRSELYRGLASPFFYDLMIHPGAGAANRRWPIEYYRALLASIPLEWRVAIVGPPADVAVIRDVAPDSPNFAYLTGTLAEAIELLGRARVVMTMDSGSMFFSNMLGVPTVALFGPSAPQHVIPPGTRIRPLLRQVAACQPCRNTTCRQTSLLCMEAITPESVLRELQAAVHSTSSTG